MRVCGPLEFSDGFFIVINKRSGRLRTAAITGEIDTQSALRCLTGLAHLLSATNDRCPAVKYSASTRSLQLQSNLGLFSELKSIFYLDAWIPHAAFDFGAAK